MHVIHAENVNVAFRSMIHHLITVGSKSESRAGEVLVAPTPVTTVYYQPTQRVLFCPFRDANPFFHLMEALWMLAGRNDVESMYHYVRRMADFSDDGETFHGAYGYRWRYARGGDQLDSVVELLTRHPNSRRAVIQIWDCASDLQTTEKCRDIPCNLSVTPWITERLCALHLDMTVFCRSNDIIWGASGANAVHFSVLQEYLATKLGVNVGWLYQVSNNFHGYLNTLEPVKDVEPNFNPYETEMILRTPLMSNTDSFDYELSRFWDWHDYMLDNGEEPSQFLWDNEIFPEVAIPMALAYNIYRKHGVCGDIYALLDSDTKYDWLKASFEWMVRKQVKLYNTLTKSK